MRYLYWLVVFLFLFWAFSYSYFIDLSKSLYVETNDWFVNLPNVIVSWNFQTWFKINIPDKYYFIFQPVSWYIYQNNCRSVVFNGNYSWNILITWLKIRVYDEEVVDWKLCINNVCSKKWVYIEKEEDNDDYLKPLPVNSFNYIISWNIVKLSWSKPCDLDAYKLLLKVVFNWKFLKDIYLPPNQTWYTFALSKEGIYKFSLFVKDLYRSSPGKDVIVIFNKEKKKERNNINNEKNTINKPKEQKKINKEDVKLQTWYVFEKKKLSCEIGYITWNVLKCKWKINPKYFKFKTKIFNYFQEKFDQKLKKVLRKNFYDVILLRNQLMQVLYDYENKKISTEKTIMKIKQIVKKLKSLL